MIVATKQFIFSCVIIGHNLILLVLVKLLIVATKHFKSNCVIMESQFNGDCMEYRKQVSFNRRAYYRILENWNTKTENLPKQTKVGGNR